MPLFLNSTGNFKVSIDKQERERRKITSIGSDTLHNDFMNRANRKSENEEQSSSEKGANYISGKLESIEGSKSDESDEGDKYLPNINSNNGNPEKSQIQNNIVVVWDKEKRSRFTEISGIQEEIKNSYSHQTQIKNSIKKLK